MLRERHVARRQAERRDLDSDLVSYLVWPKFKADSFSPGFFPGVSGSPPWLHLLGFLITCSLDLDERLFAYLFMVYNFMFFVPKSCRSCHTMRPLLCHSINVYTVFSKADIKSPGIPNGISFLSNPSQFQVEGGALRVSNHSNLLGMVQGVAWNSSFPGRLSLRGKPSWCSAVHEEGWG